jgi:class 3 adenylate cyclase
VVDPKIAVHHGRTVMNTGDGVLVEFQSVVDAVRGAVEVQNATAERNAEVPVDRRIEFRATSSTLPSRIWVGRASRTLLDRCEFTLFAMPGPPPKADQSLPRRRRRGQ